MINEEELREALGSCKVTQNTAGHGMVAYSVGSWLNEGKAEIILQAAQAYLEQKPCVDAIKAARREATEGVFISVDCDNRNPEGDYVSYDVSRKDDDGEQLVFECYTKEDAAFATTAANEAARLIAMDST